MRKLRNNESNLWEENKRSKTRKLCSHITFLSVVQSHRQAGGQGGNVKINVYGIAAKSGRNGGNFGAAQSSSFGASSCGNKVQIATFLWFAQLLAELPPVCRDSFHLLCHWQCVRGKQQAIKGKVEIANLSRSTGQLDCGNVRQWWISTDHQHYRIKVRLKFLQSFWYFSDVTDRPFSFSSAAIRQDKVQCVNLQWDRHRKKWRRFVGF